MKTRHHTTIEQHQGNHPSTGLPMVALHEIVTSYVDYVDYEDGRDWEDLEDETREWWVAFLADQHDAEVELDSLPADLRAVAYKIVRAGDPGDLEDEPARIREAIARARSVGRPAKSADGTAAKARIELRCTEAQKARIKTLANDAGLSVSDYILSKTL